MTRAELADEIMDREMWNIVTLENGEEPTDERYKSYCEFVLMIFGLKQ